MQIHLKRLAECRHRSRQHHRASCCVRVHYRQTILVRELFDLLDVRRLRSAFRRELLAGHMLAFRKRLAGKRSNRFLRRFTGRFRFQNHRHFQFLFRIYHADHFRAGYWHSFASA